MPGPLFLQSHVFLARGKRHWVILDVNRDKYLCVDRHQFEALAPLLKRRDGAPGRNNEDSPAVGEEAAGLADQLLGLGILSTDGGAPTQNAFPTAYALPTEAVDPSSPAPSRWLSCVHAGSFFLSSARASRELLKQRFQATVESVRARKSRHIGAGAALDLERTRSLVAIFERLRLFYPRSYLCLFDSLALIHFLARFHVYPDWVFGVNADPFEAHCWVQAGRVVLNDRVERVSGFTPIMCV